MTTTCDHTLIQKSVSWFHVWTIWVNRFSILQTPESWNSNKGLVRAISSLNFNHMTLLYDLRPNPSKRVGILCIGTVYVIHLHSPDTRNYEIFGSYQRSQTTLQPLAMIKSWFQVLRVFATSTSNFPSHESTKHRFVSMCPTLNEWSRSFREFSQPHLLTFSLCKSVKF